ncbi:histidinol-phosphatase [Marinobacterium weihaiense]|uniref:HAD-IB family hydrolase n=1 Tax=Marinobacterium weihaiense TaxID=2851016 RepID=A0ABS6MDR0_9GAMM|nr:HAD family hydrolase [Marinobacterium weihaiense]MBV0933994.1 HAD-IB family hydrolase [Marinobacterium weihaiense]
MSLAIFDLDHTLIGGDSDHAWGEFLCRRGVVDEQEYRAANDRFYEEYLRGEMDIHAFLNFALNPLALHAPEQLNAWHAEFMAECIEPIILPKAEQLLAEHRAQGDFLLIITATNRFVTAPIAKRLGVDAMLATEPEVVDGRFTGRVAGTPCFQGGKVTRLHAWLEETGHSLDGSWFYSDSNNDLPLLEVVDNPVATNPDDRLRATAQARGWQILQLMPASDA